MSFRSARQTHPARRSPGAAWARIGSFLVATALVALAGCEQDEVQHYQAPKPPMFRLLGAIFPRNDTLWFFKVSGPVEDVKHHAREVADFYASVRFDNDAIQWKKPPTWREEAGKGTRSATFFFGQEDEPLELTVSSFKRPEEMSLADAIQANVTRWRRQMGLTAAHSSKEIETMAPKKEINGVVRYTMDVVGTRPGKTRPAVAPDAEQGPIQPPAKEEKPAAKPKYLIPTGWQELPGAADNIVLVAFRIVSGPDQAMVTIAPLGPMAGGLRANVDRWCGQIGMAKLSNDELIRRMHSVTVEGKEATAVDLLGPKPDAPGILAVIVGRKDHTWFFKMTGPTGLLSEQKNKFEEFVRSVRFP